MQGCELEELPYVWKNVFGTLVAGSGILFYLIFIRFSVFLITPTLVRAFKRLALWFLAFPKFLAVVFSFFIVYYFFRNASASTSRSPVLYL